MEFFLAGRLILPRVSRSDGAFIPDDHIIVLFGGLGDLARRKLLPGLFHLDRAGLMPADYKIIGTSRRGGSDDDFRRVARDAIGERRRRDVGALRASGCPSARSAPRSPNPCRRPWRGRGRPGWGAPAPALTSRSRRARSAISVVAIGSSGLADARAGRVGEAVRRRPGERARAQYARPRRLPEERVFRIDHFLGREAVQNLIALRFANGMFEPIWNRDHIDHVQIDVPETLAVDDRAGFYEGIGAYRDMVVTHLFHVLGFVAMEPPTTLEARSIVEETGKVFRSV